MTNGSRPADVRLRLPDRTQVVMAIRSPDDLVDADHPVRVVWRMVCALDLGRFYEPIRARDGAAGRDATDPRLLVALWLWAATDGVGSARELARLCAEGSPYLWLCGGVSVNHHTLADFRVGHGAALDDLLTQVIASLVSKEAVAAADGHGGGEGGLQAACGDERDGQRGPAHVPRARAADRARAAEGPVRGAVVRAGVQRAALRRPADRLTG
jgi:transposase